MKAVLKPCKLVTILSLLLLCSCAAIHPRLLADVPMNKDAGRGAFLIVPVRLDNGQKLPFIVDTGAEGTLFDKSLEPILGKPLSTAAVGELAGVKSTNSIYTSPKLHLGGAPLMMTGTSIAAWDLRSISAAGNGQPVKGILGMDVLEHYCIQLDFAARKMRFLDGDRADKRNWGKAFPIVALSAEDTRPAVRENLFGAHDSLSLIDSGYNGDGWLMPKYFQQWTNGAAAGTNGEVRCPDGMFGGERYPFVSLDEQPFPFPSDGIALRFLARHLVTLDFPRHTLYLKRTSIGPLLDDVSATAMATAASFLKDLKKKGRLPGWSKDEHSQPGGVTVHLTGNSATVDARKKDDPSTYHYTVIRAAKNGSWKLQKAWRTDQDGKTIEEFPVP